MINPISVNGVYYVETKNNVANPIAIRPVINGDYVSWEDTSHGRVVTPKKIIFDGKEGLEDIQGVPNRIDIITGVNSEYHLIKLTLKVFDEKVKAGVAGSGDIHFKTDEEVQEYYLNTDFYAVY